MFMLDPITKNTRQGKKNVIWELLQALYLEQILRETRSHPGVNGIVMWAAWRAEGCYRMCLTDNNFNNLKTGDVVDKLLHEWGWEGFIAGTTDANGFFETSLFHGDYHVKIKHPDVKNSSLDQILIINVSPTITGSQQTVLTYRNSKFLQLEE